MIDPPCDESTRLHPVSTHDQDVFRFYHDGRACVGVPEVLQRYRELAGSVHLSGTMISLTSKSIGLVFHQYSGYKMMFLMQARHLWLP